MIVYNSFCILVSGAHTALKPVYFSILLVEQKVILCLMIFEFLEGLVHLHKKPFITTTKKKTLIG